MFDARYRWGNYDDDGGSAAAAASYRSRTKAGGHYRRHERGFLLSSGVALQPVSKPTLSGARHSKHDSQRTRNSVFSKI